MIQEAVPDQQQVLDERRFVRHGVPEAIIRRLQDPSCTLDECVQLVGRFNAAHPPLRGVRHKLPLALDKGRTITLYYDNVGGLRLGHGGFAEAAETKPDRPWAARDPRDPVFQQWFQKMYARYQQYFLQEAHRVDPELNTEEAQMMRFLYEAIGYLTKQPEVSDEVMGYVATAHANLKQKLLKVGTSIYENTSPAMEALPSAQGVDAHTCVDRQKQLPRELGERFYGHGLVKGRPWQRLRMFLEQGIDPSRELHKEKLLGDADSAIGNGSNRPGCMFGGFTLISHPDRYIDAKSGIAAVLVNWEYRELVPYLRQKYPNTIFTTPENLTPTLQKLVQRAAP